MGIVDTTSLAGTLNALTLAVLEGRKLSQADRRAAAWIAGRLKQKGYCGLPAPTEADRHRKLVLFTGEQFGSRAGTGCKLGFEATWALATLDADQPAAAAALKTCREIVIGRFVQDRKGMYCCCSCSNAGWRALSVLPGAEPEKYLRLGIEMLHSCRESNGRWSKFPFWYSVLALSQAQLKQAKQELAFAAPALEKALRKPDGDDEFAQHRKLLARYVLGRI